MQLLKIKLEFWYNFYRALIIEKKLSIFKFKFFYKLNILELRDKLSLRRL